MFKLAGITRTSAPPHDPPPPPPEPDPLPGDVAALTAIIKDLEQKNRLERAAKARVLVELDLARDELREVAFNRAMSRPKASWVGSLAGSSIAAVHCRHRDRSDHPRLRCARATVST